MKIDHVHFYTRNAARTRDWLVNYVGFQAISNCITPDTHTELVALNSAYFALSSPLTSTSPVAQYLNSHPSGVGDIAFRVSNLEDAIARAERLGFRLLQKIQVGQSPQGEFKFAQIFGWQDLRHTLIEAPAEFDYALPLEIEPYQVSDHHLANLAHLTQIDHVVLNVAQGKLNDAVNLYCALFDLQVQQHFKIQTDKSGLASQALIDNSGSVQFNINQPTDSNSQIQEFIDLNHGSGIQHLALRSDNLITDVTQMRQRGLEFLTIPAAYYQQLSSVANLSPAEQKAIAEQQILVDCDRLSMQSLLMQIFTQPIFEQPTFFLELIERRQNAQGFGQGNFKALFEAVEREQSKRFVDNDVCYS